jgi:hypothetical protein
MPLNATFSAASIRGYSAQSVNFWNPTQVVTASDAGANDAFGTSLAVDSNNLYMAVSASGDNTGGNQGSVYIFFRGSGSWVQQQKITSPTTSLNFATRQLAMNANGDYLAIPDTQVNRVYVYTRVSSTWTLQATLTGSDTVAGDQFGRAISISSNGDYLVVGAPNADISGQTDAGAAYIFIRSGTTWTQQAKLQASDRQANDILGTSVVINSTGDFVALGAPQEDNVGSNAGATYFYTRSGTTWTQRNKVQSSDVSANDNFGGSLSISADNLYLIIGARGDNGDSGSVYVFNYIGGSIVYTQGAKVTPNIPIAGQLFGTNSDINFDGTRMVVSVESNSADGQSVYLFERSGSTWTQSFQIVVNNQSQYFGLGSDGPVPGIVVGTSNPNIIICDFGADAGAGNLSGVVNYFNL